MTKDYIINPNPDFIHRKKIEEEIKNNNGFCITALKQTEDTKCICKEFKEQKTGWCNCGQFYKVLRLPKVYLSGSSRFKEVARKVAKEFTLQGYNVILPIDFTDEDLSKSDKDFLDEVSQGKIAEADLIYVINCDNYIGETVRKEINWAAQLGKKIQYLENNKETTEL